ncbi:hypothetical protein C8R45DRAFT_756872, partial [Mycena sanguinolenta]
HRIRLNPDTDSAPFEAVVCELREDGAPVAIGMAIGSSDLEVFFPTRAMSSKHAELSVTSGPKFFIRDTKSASGTFLNGVRLCAPNTLSSLYEIKDGDRLQLGV